VDLVVLVQDDPHNLLEVQGVAVLILVAQPLLERVDKVIPAEPVVGAVVSTVAAVEVKVVRAVTLTDLTVVTGEAVQVLEV
jgi:hypothetical protein